ncbi:MAG TPA: hypothetical protein VIR77_05880 [Pontiella sp.]
MHTQICTLICFVFSLSITFAGAFPVKQAGNPVEIKAINVADLMKPSAFLTDVVCNTPEGVVFTPSGEHVWKLEGGLANKSGTVTFRPESGSWDVSKYSYVRIDLKNSGPGLVWIRGRLDNPGAEDWHNSTPSSAFIMPGERAVLGFPFPRADEANDAPAIFDRQSGKPNGHRTHWKPFDPANVTACLLRIESTAAELSLEDITISLTQPYGAEANAELLELPYLDPYGQVRKLDWPGKLQSAEELKQRAAEERKALARDPGPIAFNQYGGWANGPELEASGYFRTEKYKGKWWFVDPLGNLFFSHGANSVGFGQTTPIEDREALFEWLPAADDILMKDAVNKGRAHFMIANLVRTFGAEWNSPACDRVHERMRRWGMNTLGAWSDSELAEGKRTPYTAILHVSGWGPLGHGIPDPFSDGFKSSLTNGLSSIIGPERNDPWCIGVFIDNEIDWTEEFVHKTFKLGPEQPARQACINRLKEKYVQVEALNEAWKTDYPSWAELSLPEQEADVTEGWPSALPEDATDALKEDLVSLKRLIAGTYYKTCRDVMREVLPNHLYLGSRMHKAPDEIMEEAMKYVDVLSLNSYEPLSGSKVPEGADLPCIDTEFHFAAPDRGGLGVGLMPVGDQLQRSRAYIAYVMAGIQHPCMVGTHWFAFADQSAAGRPGENYQIGFVDVTDTPYPEITKASRQMADRMYSVGVQDNKSLLEVLEALWRK